MGKQAKSYSNISSARFVTPVIRLLLLIIILALSSIAYHALHAHELNHTALMFVGLPTLLAIALTLTPPSKSITGGIVKGITIALLMSGVVFHEGFVCILMASPLFYGVGIMIGSLADKERKKDGKDLKVIVLPALLLLSSMEGINEEFSFNRNETVTVEKVVPFAEEVVVKQLASSSEFNAALPLMLRIGFPLPVSSEGSGLNLGDIRVVHFKIGNEPPAPVSFIVTEKNDNSARFNVVEDKTKINSWLSWRDSTVEWQAIDGSHTRIRWTLQYRRQLDPAWYFGPLQRYVVGLAAETLIDQLASPND